MAATGLLCLDPGRLDDRPPFVDLNYCQLFQWVGEIVRAVGDFLQLATNAPGRLGLFSRLTLLHNFVRGRFESRLFFDPIIEFANFVEDVLA